MPPPPPPLSRAFLFSDFAITDGDFCAPVLAVGRLVFTFDSPDAAAGFLGNVDV